MREVDGWSHPGAELLSKTSAYPAGHASVQQPSHRLGPGLQDNPRPRRRSQSRTDVRFVISLGYCAEYPRQEAGQGGLQGLNLDLFVCGQH